MSFLDFVTVNHGVIALAYYTLAIITLTTFFLRDVSTTTNTIARIAGASFFVGCGLTHVDLIAHAYPTATAMDYTSFHHAVAAVMQTVGASVFVAMVLLNGTRGFYFKAGKRL